MASYDWEIVDEKPDAIKVRVTNGELDGASWLSKEALLDKEAEEVIQDFALHIAERLEADHRAKKTEFDISDLTGKVETNV